MKIAIAASVILAAVVGCSPAQQAIFTAPGVLSAVTDPKLSATDKACTVLNWGLPIARERMATFTAKQQTYALAADRVASAYCAARDLSWRDRAVTAADELSLVLWDVLK